MQQDLQQNIPQNVPQNSDPQPRWHPHLWHPTTQVATAPVPLRAVAGRGALLQLDDGRTLIDAISSWWVTLHGHAEASIAAAVSAQCQALEQVIFADFSHAPAERLAERLSALAGLERLFFSDNGSTAVEVALKIAWQWWHNQGAERRQLIAFEGAYHGDTVGAMAVGARSLFTTPFDPWLFSVARVDWPHTCWHDATVEGREQAALEALERALAVPTAAVILEPLIQGASGMAMVRPAFLQAVQERVRASGALLIADEVMTGFGRSGALFACQRAGLQPDLMALSKGLTGGFLPMGVTLASERLYQGFISNDPLATFFHGHSFTANPLGCAAALASLDLLEALPGALPQLRGSPPAAAGGPQPPAAGATPPLPRHRGGLRRGRGPAGLPQRGGAPDSAPLPGRGGVRASPRQRGVPVAAALPRRGPAGALLQRPGLSPRSALRPSRTRYWGVPAAESRDAPIPREHREGGRVEQQLGAGRRRQPQPAGGEHPQQVAVGEQRHRPLGRPRPGDQPIRPAGHRLGGFALRAAVPEHQPVRLLGMDLVCGEPLIAPVVPLLQVGVEHRPLRQSRQGTGLAGALQRAAEHQGEGSPHQGRLQLARLGFPARGERQVGAAGVLAREAPGRLAVAHQQQVMGWRSRGGHRLGACGGGDGQESPGDRIITAVFPIT